MSFDILYEGEPQKAEELYLLLKTVRYNRRNPSQNHGSHFPGYDFMTRFRVNSKKYEEYAD